MQGHMDGVPRLEFEMIFIFRDIANEGLVRTNTIDRFLLRVGYHVL
jgi:hypothetical protein